MIPQNVPISSSSSKSSSETQKSDKPSGRVDPDKFRQVFEVEDRKDPNGAILEEEEIDPQKAREKKFGLAKKKGVKSTSDGESGSIFDMAKESSTTKKLKGERFLEPPSQFSLSQGSQQTGILDSDVSSVQGTRVSEQIEKIEKIQEIIDKITQEILQLEDVNSGETVTLIYLNDDTPFKGASIKISEFDTANKQINITIDNLTQQAKELIDSRAQKLIEKLSEIGYQVPNLMVTCAKINERIQPPPQMGSPSSFAKKGDEEESRREDKPKK